MHGTVARNVLWNWAGMGINMLAGFAVAPFLVHRLGNTNYGLWILIASMIYYFGLLDMGVRGAVGRQIAFCRANNDRAGVNTTMNTALLMLGGAGLLALAGTLVVLLVFFRLFDVPPDQVAAVRLAVLLVGLNLAIWLPLDLFDSMLWAYQRFDLINVVDMTSALARTALSVYVVYAGYGLVGLSLAYLLTLAGTQGAKALMVWRLDPTLKLGMRFISARTARNLLGIGVWNTVLSLAVAANGQIGPLIIGSRLGVGLITPFSIAARLMATGRDFLVASTGVLTPVAIGFHANKRKDDQRRLFLHGGQYCLVLSLFFLILFSVLGESIIRLWMGPSLQWAARLLLILVLGEALPMSQWVSYSIMLGEYRHRALATIRIVETVVAVTLALIFVRWWGLIGVCVAFAIPGALCRGLFQLLYTCRLMGLSIRTYFVQVLLPGLCAASLPAAALIAMSQWQAPRTWIELLAHILVFGVIYMAALMAVFGRGWMRQYHGEMAVEMTALRGMGRRIFGPRLIAREPEEAIE